MVSSILPVTACNGPWPLHDAAASRRLEADASASHASGELMARAGLAVARLALALAPQARRVHVWAGPGNNGGDGLVAARHLHRAGLCVSVSLLGDPARLPDDAAHAWQAAQAAGVPWQRGLAPGFEADLHIDALLGLGVRRAPQGEMADAIERLNGQAAPVLAVDLPSGLHPDTGAILGKAAVQAGATLALLTLKPGCFTHRGRDCAGALWLASLGAEAPASGLVLSGPPALLQRPHAAHKGTHGNVLAVGGAAGMRGAAWLAASAALAAGAGRVVVSCIDEIESDAASPCPQALPPRLELMTHQRAWLAAPTWLSQQTVVCGCGGGNGIQAALPPLLAHAARLVLDADALNAIAEDNALLTLLQSRGMRGLPTLCTPHPLEAARLLSQTTTQVQGNRLDAAHALALRLRSAVLLKGSGSVIAAPAGTSTTAPPCWINSTGNAALATAGTGDVLAGWVAGLWAQQPTATPQQMAVAAAWQHGFAADQHARFAPGRPLRATDLIERLAQLSAPRARLGQRTRGPWLA